MVSFDQAPRICIVGPGAMGLLHAAYLRRAGFDVSLLDHHRLRAQRLNDLKVVVQIENCAEVVDIPCHATPNFGPVDLIIFFVKAYSTADAAAHAAPLIGSDTVLLTLQNGLGNLEIIEQYQRIDRVLAGASTSGATLLDFNMVRQEGLGDILIGSPLGRTGVWGANWAFAGELAGEVVELFQRAGLPARVVDDVHATLWRKTVINAAINPLTAITSLENGQLLEHPYLRQLLNDLTVEAATVAQATHPTLTPDEMVPVVEEVCRLTAHNRSSMLQDITHGRRTEVDYINGAIVKAGLTAGLATPLNQAMLALIKTLEPTAQ